MSLRPKLHIAPCSHEAAKYAVEKWHYSHVMPVGKLFKLGVWENEKYIGTVIFGTGAAPQASYPYNITRFEICELVRVALGNHITQVSKIVAVSLRVLARKNYGLRLVVSYADPSHGHIGAIYQAGNWVYVGTSEAKWKANGIHNRRFGTSIKRAQQKLGEDVSIIYEKPKYKYLYPLDMAMREYIEPLRKPYPKRDTSVGSVDSDTSGYQPEEGGASPTPTLQNTGVMND